MKDRTKTIRHLQTEISALDQRLDSTNNLIVSLRAQLEAHETRKVDDRRTQVFRRAAIDLVPDESTREFSNLAPITIKDMGEALVAVGSRLDHKFAEIEALSEVTGRMNAGVFFNEVLDHVFEHFKSIIPYDRIGVALIEESKSGQTLVRSQWNRATYEPTLVNKGYAAILEDSSLKQVADTKNPRIINNLESYFDLHGESKSTPLLIKEGILSSLTCPLVVQDDVIGFIFFRASIRTPTATSTLCFSCRSPVSWQPRWKRVARMRTSTCAMSSLSRCLANT